MVSESGGGSAPLKDYPDTGSTSGAVGPICKFLQLIATLKMTERFAALLCLMLYLGQAAGCYVAIPSICNLKHWWPVLAPGRTGCPNLDGRNQVDGR
jgi:hypothetical protein